MQKMERLKGSSRNRGTVCAIVCNHGTTTSTRRDRPLSFVGEKEPAPNKKIQRQQKNTEKIECSTATQGYMEESRF